MSEQYLPSTPRASSRADEGWLVFAGLMVILAGLFTAVMGVVALVADEHYVVGPEGTWLIDLTGWGWLHLAVGLFAVGIGVALGTGATWARVVAVLLACFNALSHLLFLDTSPLRSAIVIALDVLVIWAVVTHPAEYR
ncbi:hypothetical protein SAMN05421504_101956 [Amycolatopsis xylanica]|uniref:DUF7144 domain-containing protein n=1 Tax=Amycolatopsis xylanica TaxID=589385 RepID=A0A1H2UPM0_9PSEU|nr:hypothetical protein [Amycolatopsis xylanica]SDW58045.1 hypothetical protein SAMN05421504_101956 [Amycolatopsis xylanica]